MATATIGSISEGTLRNSDLYDAFFSTLRHLDPSGAEEFLAGFSVDGGESLLEAGEKEGFDWEAFYESEDGSFAVEALEERLRDLAPDYCTFGAADGDGASFGFWPDVDTLEEDARYTDDVVKVDSLPSYIMQVSDHGNVTLYRVTGVEEVWSVV